MMDITVFNLIAMTTGYNKLSTGWKRLIWVAYVGFSIYVINEVGFRYPIETLFIWGIDTLVVWGLLFLLLWLIDGFKK